MRDIADVKKRLKQLGASWFTLRRAEVRALADLLIENEKIEGVIFGSHAGGWGLLVATNVRLMMVDTSFFRTTCDDVTYQNIGDVELNAGPFRNDVVVYTRSKEFHFRWVNRKQMYRFARAVEDRMHAAQSHRQTAWQNIRPRFDGMQP